MNKILSNLICSVILLIAMVLFAMCQPKDTAFITYTVDTKQQELRMYWKDEQGRPFRSIRNLKDWLQRKGITLQFAMNGGMYKEDNTPQGLLIEENRTLVPLDTTTGTGNFYLKPNGVFYTTTDNKAVVCKTAHLHDSGTVRYATQSGPMLLINGQMHPAFKKGSSNLNIRNGVGILPDGKVVFAMSKAKVNLYDFAAYFKALGCSNALYLDGLVSRTYLPQQNWIQTDGDFGVIIGVTDRDTSKVP